MSLPGHPHCCICDMCMGRVDFSGNPIELAPIVRQTGRETVFGGTDNSHISFVGGKGFHVTTPIRGLGKAEGFDGGFSHHDDIDP